MKKKSRRNFIKKSSLIGSGIFIVPRNALGGAGFIPPSDQLNIAAIGAGGKGSDIRDSWVSNERVIALCDVHPYGKHGVIQSRKKFDKCCKIWRRDCRSSWRAWRFIQKQYCLPIYDWWTICRTPWRQSKF